MFVSIHLAHVHQTQKFSDNALQKFSAMPERGLENIQRNIKGQLHFCISSDTFKQVWIGNVCQGHSTNISRNAPATALTLLIFQAYSKGV